MNPFSRRILLFTLFCLLVACSCLLSLALACSCLLSCPCSLVLALCRALSTALACLRFPCSLLFLLLLCCFYLCFCSFLVLLLPTVVRSFACRGAKIAEFDADSGAMALERRNLFHCGVFRYSCALENVSKLEITEVGGGGVHTRDASFLLRGSECLPSGAGRLKLYRA